MKEYAAKVGADFFAVGSTTFKDPLYEKLRVYEYLGKYPRVLFLDADILIRENAPDLFELVPYHELGVYVESYDVPERILQTTYMWDKNNLEYNSCKYVFNAGVMLFSEHQRKSLKLYPEVNLDAFMRFKEQCWLNYLFRNHHPYDITHKFNHMDLSGQPETDIYFRHYAGSDRKKLLKIIKGEDNGNT